MRHSSELFLLFLETADLAAKLHASCTHDLPQGEGLVFSRKFINRPIAHFTVVGLVTWPLNGSEAGGDLVLIQTSMLLLCKSSCSYAN